MKELLVWSRLPIALAALLTGIVASVTLGALVLAYMVDVGADVIVAVVAALTPNPAP